MAKNLQNNDLVESREEELADRQLMETFFETQKQEAEVRRAEILVHRDDLQNQKEIALQSIAEQAKDREQTRNTFSKESTKNKLFSGFMLVAVMVFASALVYQGETELAERLIALLSGLGLGAFGGYGYAMHKTNRA